MTLIDGHILFGSAVAVLAEGQGTSVCFGVIMGILYSVVILSVRGITVCKSSVAHIGIIGAAHVALTGLVARSINGASGVGNLF